MALNAAGVRAIAVAVASLALRPGARLSGTYDPNKSRDQRKPTDNARNCPHNFPLVRLVSWRLTSEVGAKSGSLDDRRKCPQPATDGRPTCSEACSYSTEASRMTACASK